MAARRHRPTPPRSSVSWSVRSAAAQVRIRRGDRWTCLSSPRSACRTRLDLLSVLQRGREWPAAVLATRLGVSRRTIRRDVGRLRRLGYRVDSRPGPASAYRLRPGRSVPPLLFTTDEVAVLVAGVRLIAPRLADAAEVDAVLAKLENVPPPSLRRRARSAPTSEETPAHPVTSRWRAALSRRTPRR
ncbi:helix-turn-helix transcriptional regulator [Rhodococcus coprophilus]|uniref:helix-turn-helix transcriptional regulator n=1 Tax=Rhodococcus coprophilus TaxID=38310 RepID=UPI0027D84AB8|nr:HTH domain-containing protein [Rhodococcus coprophilus]